MNRLIEAKPFHAESDQMAPIVPDQASALRSMVGRNSPTRAHRPAWQHHPRPRKTLRIVWLVEHEDIPSRTAITRLAAGIAEREGIEIAWDTDKTTQGWRIDDAGLLMVFDSCAGVADALRRIRHAVAGCPLPPTRTAASDAWIAAMGLAPSVPAERALSAALRGLCDTADRLIQEPVEPLGVHRRPRRSIWSPRNSHWSEQQVALQRIEDFLTNRARSACAIP